MAIPELPLSANSRALVEVTASQQLYTHLLGLRPSHGLLLPNRVR